ncbi:PIR Superfamily Protein [Plasmodium ovale wallikeri]|uniref:PIR Superfamily Protein n=1 Tax=Plasmodium ovale wallikeri TaxID=864142 RepID=A0A1A9ACS6_PLAOA|nr:PIR Superfamily Protein [Plasmodium ovale wallikeri]
MTTDSMNEHYETVKSYLYHYNTLNDTKDPTSISDDFFNTHFSNGIENRPNFIDNCKILNYYIKRSISLESIDTSVCFEIINFWLNEQVRSGSDKMKSSLFDMYKKFMEKYNNLKLYVTKIYYIHDNVFNKKKKLYELYKDYDKLLTKLDTFNLSHCANLSSIVDDYNNIVGQYSHKDNHNFFEALRDFRNHFESQQYEYINSCGNKILKFEPFSEQHVSRAVITDHSGQSTGDADQFHTQSSEKIASTFALTLVGTTVGVFLTLMLFYKITLYGYSLRNQKNKQITMPNDLDEEIYELPVHRSDELDWDSQHRTYNLTYQSSKN